MTFETFETFEEAAQGARAAWTSVAASKQDEQQGVVLLHTVRYETQKRDWKFCDALHNAVTAGFALEAIVAKCEDEAGFPSLNTCKKKAALAAAFPPRRRAEFEKMMDEHNHILSMDHFKTVIDLPSRADQDLLLQNAIEQGWGRDRIRAETQSYRVTVQGGRPRVVRRSRLAVDERLIRQMQAQAWSKSQAGATVEEMIRNVLAQNFDLYRTIWPKRRYTRRTSLPATMEN